MSSRIQLKRTAGWRMPPNTVKVDRSTRWGNPYRSDAPTPAALKAGARTAADAFRLWLSGHPELVADFPDRRRAILDGLSVLRGRDLACWCRPGAKCHADVLIELANGREDQQKTPPKRG